MKCNKIAIEEFIRKKVYRIKIKQGYYISFTENNNRTIILLLHYISHSLYITLTQYNKGFLISYPQVFQYTFFDNKKKSLIKEYGWKLKISVLMKIFALSVLYSRIEENERERNRTGKIYNSSVCCIVTLNCIITCSNDVLFYFHKNGLNSSKYYATDGAMLFNVNIKTCIWIQ